MLNSDITTITRFFGATVLNETVCISLKHNYIYFEVPKAGSTSILDVLHELELRTLPEPVALAAHPPNIGSPFVKPYQLGERQFADLLGSSEVFKFTFVRNPYTRLLSSYLDKVMSGDAMTAKYYRDQLELPPTGPVSFAEFARRVSGQSPGQMNKHWRPQVYQSLLRFCDLDMVGKLETLQDDFDRVQRRIGADVRPVGHVAPHATQASSRLAQFYDAETADIVASVYAEDFAAFGYDTTRPGI